MLGGRYIVHKLNENTYAIEEKSLLGQGLCYLLCGEEKALLIDTCFGFDTLKPTVKSLTDLPVVVANTHAHLDHIGGNHCFDEIWYHKEDRRIFDLHTSWDYLYPLLEGETSKILALILKPALRRLLPANPAGNYRYFEDGHIFRLGGRDIEVVHTPGHTPGSVCFLDRSSRMLFSGDTVCEWGILLLFRQESCPPAVFLASMQRLKALWDTFDLIWPGHHGFPVNKSYIDDYLTCAEQIVAGTAKTKNEKGRLYAYYNRVQIALPKEEPPA